MPSSYQPAAPIAFAPQAVVTPTTAVPVERYRGDYEAPADEQQRYYLMGVQGKFETEQSMMGALDGEWTVMAPAGGPTNNVAAAVMRGRIFIAAAIAGDASIAKGRWPRMR